MKKRTRMLFKFLVAFTSLLFYCSVVFAQTVTITGKVTGTDDRLPRPGVTVLQKGTSNGTSTGMNGEYTISVPKGATLQFSFIGMLTKDIIVGNETVINVELEPSTVQMGEVVVTALGISREKKSLGFAVTEVSGQDISRVKDLNVVNSLSGRVSGVVVTQGTFGPGSSSRVIIRGNNSITGNNQPLYVVDGIPIDNSGYGSASSANAGEYSKSDYGSGVSDINPDDIESISVLKGPNAAALYGARAANGVILITTKKGVAGKGLGVTYSTNIAFESPMLLPEFQNEYGQGTQGNVPPLLGDLRASGGSWGAKLDGSSKIYWNGETKPYSPQPDNVKNFFRTGSTYINTLAFDGGNQQSTFRFAYTNTAAKSILPGSNLDRHNFTFRGTTNLTDKLSVDAKVTYFVQKSKNRPVMGTEGVMAYLYPIPRNTIIDDLKDYQNPADYSVNSYSSGSGNPYWYMLHDVNNENRDRVQGYVKANYKLTDYLSAFVRIGTDAVSQKIETINQYGHWYYGGGRLNNSVQKNTETNLDALIMFNKSVTDKIDLMINVGANHMYQTYEAMSIFAENFKIPTKPTLSSASNNLPSYTPLSEKIINSVYGSAQISYGKFLYLETSMRNDWSSTLPKNNWSYFYPSVSLSAILSELIKLPVMDFGKIRINWAKVGSDTSPYQLLNSFNLSSAGDSYLGLTILTRPSTRNNPNLKPEQTSSLEFGGEFRFFSNRIYADLSYYDIKSRDLIMDVPIPASTGYSYERTNVGEMQNTGFEILIGGIPVQNSSFRWDISVNMSHNKNKLNNLITGVDNYIFSTTNSGAVEVMARVGGGYGDIFATTYLRDANGKIVVDAQGRFMAAAEKKFVGNYQPDWVGGMTNSVTYKNLNLRFLIDARFGGKIYSGTDAGLDAQGVSKNSLKYRESGVVIDGVKSDGSTNTTNISAEQYWGSYSGIAENYIFSQTNIRLRELSLTYDLPASILDKTFIKGVSVGITGRNLFFIYRALKNFDPEGSFSTSNFAQGVLFYNMPTTRSLGFNLNVKF